MKTIIKDLQKGITIGIGIVLVLGITGISYSVWDGLNAETGDSLTAAKWNELVNKVESNNSIESGFPDLITCLANDGNYWFYVLSVKYGTTGNVLYNHFQSGTRYMIFNSDLTWNSDSGDITDCSGKSLTTLISEGKTKNFIN